MHIWSKWFVSQHLRGLTRTVLEAAYINVPGKLPRVIHVDFLKVRRNFYLLNLSHPSLNILKLGNIYSNQWNDSIPTTSQHFKSSKQIC